MIEYVVDLAFLLLEIALYLLYLVVMGVVTAVFCALPFLVGALVLKWILF